MAMIWTDEHLGQDNQLRSEQGTSVFSASVNAVNARIM
jgi:hypothetical protein